MGSLRFSLVQGPKDADRIRALCDRRGGIESRGFGEIGLGLHAGAGDCPELPAADMVEQTGL